ncbi:uncharacterized protein LOC109863664 isoform X2 [Pseudomyrmex gracilis]|uniref:uncharacterized protein LOC109863664 isoform X2 n=1 Tax=Pseudomyrmex gracilis TaxID=219809 RepID=UPI000995CABD|nr:uncharacterized protein LOC109863664 isoform X2 [Pseudomyrmex gracilis]
MHRSLEMASTKCYFVFVIILLLLERAMNLECYQCSSEDEWKCMNNDLVETSLVPTNCDHIHEARYCVKTIGRYGGGIGTKRFCSSAHMGNYCDYVKQPGDKLMYRTCVFTCSSDGCNPATYLQPNFLYTLLIPVSLLIIWSRQFCR